MRFLAILLLVLMADSSSYAYADVTAEEIIVESWRLYRQANNEKETIDITINNNGGAKEKTLTRWTKFSPDGEDKIISKFSKPAVETGLGRLIWRNSLGDKQWLKLPSMRRTRKVSVNNQAKYFAGTDITYEDARQLVSERTNDFNYYRQGEENECWIIKAVPKKGVNSGYSKRIFWINQTTFAVNRIEYYNTKKDLLKIQYNQKIQITKNGRWRVNQVKIKNTILSRCTTIKIIKRQVNVDLPLNIFSKRFLLKK